MCSLDRVEEADDTNRYNGSEGGDSTTMQNAQGKWWHTSPRDHLLRLAPSQSSWQHPATGGA